MVNTAQDPERKKILSCHCAGNAAAVERAEAKQLFPNLPRPYCVNGVDHLITWIT